MEQAKRIGNVIYNLRDQYTNELFTTTVKTTKPDGSAYTDSDVNNVLVFANSAELGGGYSTRNYTGAANVKWFGAIGNGAANDTSAIQKAVTWCDKVYFPTGDYGIFSPITVPQKNIEITASPDAYFNKKFIGNGFMILFSYCPNVYLNFNMRNSLPSRLKFNDNGLYDGIPQMRVEGLDSGIFGFDTCKNVVIKDSRLTQLYSYTVFSITNGFIEFRNVVVDDEVYVDSVIHTYGEENLKMRECIFRDISLIPDSFDVIKGSATLPQTSDSTAYAWQYGQGLSILGNNLDVKGCIFENISGLSIGADHQVAAGLSATNILIQNNDFIANSTRTRGANPPGFIWLENQQGGIIRGNRFTFTKRGSGDGKFQLLRWALARRNAEIPYFEYSGNFYITADGSTDNSATVNILTRNSDAIINISGNTHYSPLSNFIYIDTVRENRPCNILNVVDNDVTCLSFCVAFNAQDFNGTYFKLPKQINISNNRRVRASSTFFNVSGEYGASDLELNIVNNNIENATGINMFDGTFKANILDNRALNTVINFLFAGSQSGTGELNIKRNHIKSMQLTSGNNCVYNIENNTIAEDSTFRGFTQSLIRDNDFSAQAILTGTFTNSTFAFNTLLARLVIHNLTGANILNNHFAGNGLGIYGFGNSNVINSAMFLRNTTTGDIIYDFMEFSSDAVFNGKSIIANNTNAKKGTGTMTAIANKPASASLIIKDNTLA